MFAVLIFSNGFGPAFDKPIWRYHQTSYVCLFWQMGQHCQHIIPIFLHWWPSCQRLLLLRTLWRKNYAILELQDTQTCVNYGVFLNFGSKTAIIILLMLRFSEKATNLEKNLPIFEFQFRNILNSTTFLNITQNWKFNYISWPNCLISNRASNKS